MIKKGEATRRIREDLKELSKAYEPTKCYIIARNSKDEVDCSLISKNFLSGELDKDVLICNERIGKCELITKGSNVVCIEVQGHQVYMLKDELSSVKEGDKLAYIVTNKGEVRVVRSPYKGLIALIDEVLGEKYTHYRVFMVIK